jgi:NADH dehydrogenase
MDAQAHRVVIVGGGFGGLNAAQALRRAPVQITLVDRRNFHLFQPLLYQVATGGLSPGNIAAPLRTILRRQRNCAVWLDEVRDFDLPRRTMLLPDRTLPYDTLVVAAGARTSYFGHDAWKARAPGLKTVEDALEIRRRVLSAFESAERAADPDERRTWLTFVVVGGGPTGVELAGTLAEIAAYTLRNEFRSIEPSEARILLVEAAPRLLGPFVEPLAVDAANRLRGMNVDVRVGTRIVDVSEQSATLEAAGSATETISTRTVLWAAGVAASPLSRKLADAAQCSSDRMGRVIVTADLTLPGHPEVFVIGDMAHCQDALDKPLPGVAPVAVQQGKYVARLIQARLRGETLPPFRYRDPGIMATIGRSAAIVQIGRFRFTGWFAWMLWLLLHLILLVRFENRVLVLVQWAWNYFTFSRSARLITDDRRAK